MALAGMNAGDRGRERFPPGSEFRNLDFLRSFAVLCVLGAHLVGYLIEFNYIQVAHKEIWTILILNLGHLGVLYFFVHTALVLMFSLDRTQPVGLVLNFYIRRIFRIYPLCIACIIVILLFKVPQVPNGTYVPWDGGEILANILLVQNLFSKPDMITPLWTLPREFQMYLVLPFFYLLLNRFRSTVVVLVLWLGFCAAVPSAPLLSCFPCFLAGVLAYQLAREKVFRLPAALWPVALCGIAVLSFALTLTILPDYRADYVVCMVLGLIIPNVVELPESWMTRTSRSVAKYSYGIYLFHDPVIWFSLIRLKSFPVPVRWAALAILLVVVPVAAYRFLEAPLIEVGRRLAARWTEASIRRREARKGVLQESPQLVD